VRGPPASESLLGTAAASAWAMSETLVVLSLLTGLLTGAIFKYLQIPIPAPPNLAGLLGIVGIYLGYRLVDALGWSFDLLGALGV